MTSYLQGKFRATLKEFVNELRDDVEQAVRPAAQAGAQVLYEEVLKNVPVSTKPHWFSGRDYAKTGKRYRFNPGTLRKAIYQVWSEDNSARFNHEYHISWNHQKAPYGFMVEYGTTRTAPVAFVRRAGEKMPAALDAAEARFMRQLKVFK